MIENYANLKPRFQKAYDLLFSSFGLNEFSFKDAEEVLKEYANKIEVLSELEKAGLLDVRPSEEDKRVKIYSLKPVEEKVKKPTKDQLLKILKAGADLIRTRVDYRVLLILLFYKAISDKFISIFKGYKKEGYTDEESYLYANYDLVTLYDEKEGKLYTWQEVIKEGSYSDFINALYKLAELEGNEEKLKNFNSLIDKTGLATLFNTENVHIIEKLLNLFGSFDFSNVSYDILGDAYEWILYYFAPDKAKEGEVYTPLEVSRLLAEIVEPEEEDIILDPACGSGSMLIEQYLYVKKKTDEPFVQLYGQEANDITAVLAELNFILHGIKDYEIYIGDSLINPKFPKAKKVVANPPWNQDGYDEDTLKRNQKHKDIFEFGYTNKQSADWAWVQLINYFSEKKAGIVLDSGALFRGGKEQNIRKEFLNHDIIDAVVLLPEKIFYNTQAPGILLILNKNKPQERKEKVLFINASQEYIQHPEIKKLNKLSDENIAKIAKAYREYKDIEGFSRVVDLEKIKENDYNLNVSLYVAPIEEEEQIDLEKEFRELEKLHQEYEEKYELIKEYIQEINKLGV